MSTPTSCASAPRPRLASQLVPRQRHGLELDVVSTDGARLLIADTRFTSLLATEARQRAITRVFGVPREDQSWLVTIVLCGSVAAVAWDALGKLLPHPRTADLEIGGSLVNMTVRGLAGLPTGTMPFAGAVIALALASRSGHDALHDLRVATHELGAAFRHRYGHLIAVQHRNGRPAAQVGAS